MRSRFLGLTLALCLTASAANAESDAVWQKPFAVQGVLGLGTPVGYAGMMLEYSPHPVFVVSAGAGLGSGTENTDCLKNGDSGVCNGPLADRVQLAGMGRFRLLRTESTAFTLGAGVSGGGYSWDEFTTDLPAHKSSDLAVWTNLELGNEFRTESGFSTRVFAGYGRMLNPASLHCINTGANSDHCPNDHQDSGKGVVYLGGSAGWAF